mgnify:CR=1 FL=1
MSASVRARACVWLCYLCACTNQKKKKKKKKKKKQIPSLNEVNRMYIRPNTLVRFRGMIQDTHNPEIYLDVYEEKGPAGQSRLRTSRYRDTAEDPEQGWELDFESRSGVYKSRHTVHCIPLPAENEWVRDHLKQEQQQEQQSAFAQGMLPATVVE